VVVVVMMASSCFCSVSGLIPRRVSRARMRVRLFDVCGFVLLLCTSKLSSFGEDEESDEGEDEDESEDAVCSESAADLCR